MVSARGFAVLVLVFASVEARAHDMPVSTLLVEKHADSATITLVLPWAELKYALPPALAEPPAELSVVQREALATYLLAHTQAVGAEGDAWTVAIDELALVRAADHVDLRTQLVLRPAGGKVGPFALRYDAITHVVMSHVAAVFQRPDSGDEDQKPRLVDLLQNPRKVVNLAWQQPARLGLWPAFEAGVMHIATGADHLLFLLTLLLPAPLLAAAGRWSDARLLPRVALLRLAMLITYFTAGHTASLLLATHYSLVVPQRPVEVGVAVTILMAACAAWRPLPFEKQLTRGLAIAFGIIHGLAFSTALASLLGGHSDRALITTGFCLGIEAIQLLLAGIVAPALVVLARTRAYATLRPAGAAIAALCALAWLYVRISAPV